MAAKMGIPVAQQQLFWHKRELTAAYDEKTLLDMNMHTGFALKGYDLVRGCGGSPLAGRKKEGGGSKRRGSGTGRSCKHFGSRGTFSRQDVEGRGPSTPHCNGVYWTHV